MTYTDAVRWLDERANLERRMDPADWTNIKLERVEQLCDLLGRPQHYARVVHIAGTKGKGSTAALTAAALQANGWRTALYTSPDLTTRRERLQINGRPIGERAFAALVEQRLQPAAAAYAAAGHDDELSYFDLLTGLAFCWFADCDAEWAVIEVGLGGRLDATNVVRPEVCAITRLGLEHTQFLGDTLAQIAREKAGIIKPGVPVVAAPQLPEAQAVLVDCAAERGAELIGASGVRAVPGGAFVEDATGRVGQRVAVDLGGSEIELTLPLLGAHQVENAAVARTVLHTIGEVRAEALVRGFSDVVWPGRLQIIDRRPWVVLDGAHTAESAARLAAALRDIPHQRTWFVLGSARDKNVAGLLAALAPEAAGFVATSVPGNPRALPAAELAAAAEGCGVRLATEATPATALALARSWAAPDDLICVTGSLYLVGAVLAGGGEVHR